MCKPKSNLTLSIEALKCLQISLLAPAIRIVQSTEDICVALVVNDGRSIEVSEYFNWIFDRQNGRRAYVLVEGWVGERGTCEGILALFDGSEEINVSVGKDETMAEPTSNV